MKFTRQLFLIFCFATVIPFFFLWFSLSEIMYKKEVANVQNQHLLIAKNLGTALRRYHTDLTASFKIVSYNMVAGRKLKQLDQFIGNLNFKHFCVADIQTGKIVGQAGHKTTPCPEKVPAKRFSTFKALAKFDKPIFTPVMAGPNDQSLIYILQKFDNKLIIAAINTDYFIMTGKAISFGKKGHAAIVDQKGNLLAHPKPAWVAARKNISKVSIIKRMLAGETGVAQFYSPALKVDMIAGFTHVKGTGWSVMIPQPISELRLAANATHGAIFPLLAIFFVIAGLVAFLVARMVLKPLSNMRDAAIAVEDGNRDVEVNVDQHWHVPQEVTDMQERFNAMAKAVSSFQKKQDEKRLDAEMDSSRKTEYFANLAHELKTPLNSILGFSSVLRKAPAGSLEIDEQDEFLDHIEKSAAHLLSFVNDLLDLNRLDGGAHNFNNQCFYLTDPIRFCETTLREQIKAKNINLTIKNDLPNLKLYTDERSLNQILINTVGNSVRYSLKDSQITISAALDAQDDLKIIVYDEGIGIPKSDLQNILQPFKRANDPRIAGISGTGLGLSIVTKLAKLHGWKFSIESEYGANTTATLIIPKTYIVENRQNRRRA